MVFGDHAGLVAAPTRLIYVGSEKPNDPPRLVAGKECLQMGYIVLSYCWGMKNDEAPWHLTAKTLQQYGEGIPEAILPQTIYDALAWVRELGERYVWIDSMCIFQDSADDWQREASQMASTYGNATMTLVAASSSVYGGVTDRRNPLRSCAAGLCLRDESPEPTVYLLPNGQAWSTPPLPPTESRGWCYQEDILSSRLVKVTQKTVLWECVGDGHKPANRALNLEQLHKHPPRLWYALWYRMVERYSNKGLTNPSDKLLAFYGIASDKLGNNYVAGIIRSDAWASLLWCRDENQIQRRPGIRYEVYVAPSWSWASLDVPILFYEASGRGARKVQLSPCLSDPELHNAQADPASFFETGAVKNGSIEISADTIIGRSTSDEPFLFGTKQGNHTYGRRKCVDPFTGEALGLIVFDVATEAEDDLLLCCALLHTVDNELWEKNGTAGLGLALSVQEKTADCLMCKRVGYIQLTAAFGRLSQRRRLKIL